MLISMLLKQIRFLITIGVFAMGLFLCLLGGLKAAEPVSSAKQLPRLKPSDVAEVMSTFEVRDGFELDLVAAEPLVEDPVAMDFDAFGRAFVVEMRGYSERRPERLGRIRLLQDTNHDGSFDQSQVYAKDLPWPTAVVCYDGGIFVGATPDIYYFKDIDGDGVADMRRLVFTGFASDSAPYRVDQLNMQAMLNSFRWGPDNRIHGATGLTGGTVFSPLRPDQSPINLRGKDFSFNPRTFDLRAESGGAQNGMSFDSRGRKFVCSNSDHLQYIAYNQAFAGLNPHIRPRSARISIAEDGPAAPVYRISPDEPWRIVRTKWRVAGAVGGPVEGGGTPSGYFTGATGATLFTGDAWGAEFVDNAFIADCGSNLIHRKELFPKGHVLTARRPREEAKIEFVRSTDNWFRPVQFSNGPDGNLYVLDMYREVIEHPWSLPRGIKQFLDLNSGNDRGRIYRIRASGADMTQRAMPGNANESALIEMLGHSNHWHRSTATRLIFERNSAHLEDELRNVLIESKNPFARMHALQVLSGMGAMKGRDVEKAFTDRSSMVQLAMIHHLGTSPDTRLSGANYQRHMSALIADDSTRFHATLLLAKHPLDSATQASLLWQALAFEKEDKTWVQFAVLNAMGDCILEFLNLLIKKGSNGMELFYDSSEFYQMIGASGENYGVIQSFDFLIKPPLQEGTLDSLMALAQGLERSGAYLLSVVPSPQINRARSVLLNWLKENDQSEPSKVKKVIAVIGQIMTQETKMQWKDWLHQDGWALHHPDLIASLIPSLKPTELGWLWKQWASWSPLTRQTSLGKLLTRQDWIIAYLLAAKKDGYLISDLTFSQKRMLMNHRLLAVRERATDLLATSEENNQGLTAEAYQSALLLDADFQNGHRLYTERCASCHRANGEGFAMGPDLVSLKTSGKNRILDSILFPNREAQPQFMAYEIELKDGESVTGLVKEETAVGLTVLQAGGISHLVLRRDITSLRGTGQSMMPEGLIAGMTQQDVADLLEFLVRLRR